MTKYYQITPPPEVTTDKNIMDDEVDVMLAFEADFAEDKHEDEDEDDSNIKDEQDSKKVIVSIKKGFTVLRPLRI